MRIADMLLSIANWLESSNNEAILLAEYDDECLQVVAESCVNAAKLLKTAASKVDAIEPPQASNLTAESLEELAAIATAFDASSDPNLKKQASVIDELLLTIAAPSNFLKDKSAAEEQRIEDLKKVYQTPAEELAKLNSVKESTKAIEDSGMTKEYRIMQHALSTRYDPDYPGVQVSRVGDGMWQSEMTKKIYNYNEGFSLSDGSKVPGGNVAEQTQVDQREYHSMFTTREDVVGKNTQ